METLYAGDVTVIRLSSTGEVEELTCLFQHIAHEQGWQPGDQLRAYRENSTYIAVEVEGTLAGGVQVVRSRDGWLPCRAVWPELDLGGCTDAAEVALLAFSREHRGTRRLFWTLCAELWRHCVTTGITELWFEIPPAILRLYRSIGWPLEIAGAVRPHWGEDFYPCHLSVPALTGAMLCRAEKSALYREIVRQALREPRPAAAQALLEAPAVL